MNQFKKTKPTPLSKKRIHLQIRGIKKKRIKAFYNKKGTYFKDRDITAAVEWLKREIFNLNYLTYDMKEDIVLKIRKSFLDLE